MSSPPFVTPPRRRDAVEHQQRILDAALEVFTSQPLAGLAAVAKVSGLTRTTVYAHYPSRQALLEQVVARTIHDAVVLWDLHVPGADAIDELEEHLRESWRALAGGTGLIQAAIDVLGSRRLDELHAPLYQRVRDLLERGRREGRLATDVPIDWQVKTWFALIHAARESSAEATEAWLIVTVIRALSAHRP